MKVLITDDETHVREAIKLLVNWEEFGINHLLEASDASAAIKIIEEECPEIIFTDMRMPGKSGSELLEWIHTHAPHSKTIVISGYDDFAYVRHTLQYGGMDYLLKPIDPMELREALKKAVESWKEDEAERIQTYRQNIEVNQIKPMYWANIFSSMIKEGPKEYSAWKEVKSEFGIKEEYEICQVVIINLDRMQKNMKERYKNHKELLLFSITNICNEVLESPKNGYSFCFGDRGDEIIAVLWGGLSNIQRTLEEIHQRLYKLFDNYFDFGIGTVQEFAAGMQESYQQAQLALKQRNLLNAKIWIHTYEEKKLKAFNPLHFKEYEYIIKTALYSGKEKAIEGAVQIWIDAIKKLESITVEYLEFWEYEYNVTRMHWMKEAFTDGQKDRDTISVYKNFSIPIDGQGVFCIDLWREELVEDLKKLSKIILNTMHKSNVISKIVKYIKENCDQEITLQDISNHFYLSKEHISRKFKQEMGENISEYIAQIRIERACLLLLNPNIKIKDVAQRVGYDDEKYFSKVFKKAKGVSPNEFRRSLT